MKRAAPLRAEPRAGERVRATIPVHYGRTTLEHAAVAENISATGIFINTNHVFPAGERLLIRIEFPQRSIERHGEVVWAIQVPEHMREAMVCGMGVTFVDGDPEWPFFFHRWQAGTPKAETPDP